jgi:Bax protein
MDKKQEYHKAYMSKYNYTKKGSKTNDNGKNILFFIIVTSLPFIFTIVLNFLLLGNKYDEPKIALNKFNNFSDEIIYNNIIKDDSLDTKIKIINNPILSLDNYSISKFEETMQNYRNSLSNKLISFEKVISPSDTTSLKKINLSSNINERKNDFINIVLPIIVDQNRKIIVLRQRLIDSKNYLNQNKTLSRTDQVFIKNLATKYSVTTKNRHKIDIINDLLISIDIIPNSIVLAQAANESGWGSSRFAIEFNALFGEYTFDNNNGVIPAQREEGKKHFVKYFKTIDKSVESYFININSHFAYDKFRKFRKILRDKNNFFNVNLLVDKLDSYAEDEEYVDTIISIIYDNKLTKYDNILSLLTIS